MNTNAIREVTQAQKNSGTMEQFVRRHEGYVLKYTASVTRRYVTRSDDVWSVALSGFIQAVNDYDADKGNFYAFAELVMKRRLIDYLRAEKKFENEIAVDPALFDLEYEDDADEFLCVTPIVAQQLTQTEDRRMTDEIEEISAVLKHYRFDFMSLAECSPKAEKTKKACAKSVAFLVKEPALMSALRAKRCLPVAAIEKNCAVPRKILERHRNYIIAAAEIMTRDCPCLADYLPIIRKELGK